jgi:membrane protein DedA with SNARE-associated domain
MSEPTGPVHSIWNAMLLLLGVCLLLWVCVKLIESIWPWLLGGLIVGLLVMALTLWMRRRKGRW